MQGPAKFLKTSAEVATYYGFKPAREFDRTLRGEERSPGWKSGSYNFPSVARASAAYVARSPQEPALSFYASPAPLHVPSHLAAKDTAEFGLSVVGSAESIGEVVLIKTLAAILAEWGAPATRVRLNALGDKDSCARFARELSAYVRKQLPALAVESREKILQNPFALYAERSAEAKEVLLDAPRPTSFLSEKSRAHLREVLEHLERLGVPYEIDDLLMGDEREARLLFAIDLPAEDGTVLGSFGGRFDDYVRRLTGRKEGLAVHGSIFFAKQGTTRGHYQQGAPKTLKPRVYFIQLGLRAKLEGLGVVDMLRAAGVPLSQSFDAAHLGPQLEAAKKLGVSHVLIMGQREALDRTVLARSTKNSSQQIIPLRDLPRFLRALKG